MFEAWEPSRRCSSRCPPRWRTASPFTRCWVPTKSGMASARDTRAPLELSRIELLRDFEADQALAVLASCVAERSFTPGQMVFKAGDSGDELFLIRRGIVRIVLPLDGGDHHNLASFSREDFFRRDGLPGSGHAVRGCGGHDRDRLVRHLTCAVRRGVEGAGTDR